MNENKHEWNVLRGRIWMKANMNENKHEWKQTLMKCVERSTLMKANMNEMCWEVEHEWRQT